MGAVVGVTAASGGSDSQSPARIAVEVNGANSTFDSVLWVGLSVGHVWSGYFLPTYSYLILGKMKNVKETGILLMESGHFFQRWYHCGPFKK